MFNEAFWFFYLIGIAGAVQAVAITFLVFGIVGTTIGGIGWLVEEATGALRMLKICGTIAFIAMLFTILVPSQQALYAGGAQYAIEAVELDDTLVAFKGIIDAKIEELTTTED